MTRLVVDPGSLRSLLPEASISRVVRVRIIAQVVEYNEAKGLLVVKQLPNLEHTDKDRTSSGVSSTASVSLANILDSVPAEATYSGTIVGIEGLYDGQTVNVYDCYVTDGSALLAPGVLSMLEGMASMKPIGG